MEEENLQFISLSEAAQITNYSQDYMSLLCRQGKLKAKKLGRNWVTTKEWVRSYVDGSNGSGVSIIPVKIKSEKIEEVIEKIEEFNNDERVGCFDFYGRSVLELVFFCFFSLVIFCNLYAFAFYVETQKYPVVSVREYAAQVMQTDDEGIVAGVSTKKVESSDIIEDTPIILELNMDVSYLDEDELVKKLQEGFTEEINIETLDGYVIVSYKNDPDKKFLYIEK